MRNHCYYAKNNDFNNGADEIRTHDLLHAMQALSQLSYSPAPCIHLLNGAIITNLSVRRQLFFFVFFSLVFRSAIDVANVMTLW